MKCFCGHSDGRHPADLGDATRTRICLDCSCPGFVLDKRPHVRHAPIIKEHIDGIERGARDLWFATYGTSTLDQWTTLRDDIKETWRERARVVIAAYKAVPLGGV